MYSFTYLSDSDGSRILDQGGGQIIEFQAKSANPL